MIRVLVVEDERAFAGALEVAIDVQPDMTCVGAVSTVDEAVQLATAHRPEVVLMDIHLPGVNGVEGTRRIKAQHVDTRVLILTADAAPDLFTEAAAAGAAGFLAKDTAFPQILAAIRAPAEEKMLVEGATLTALLRGLEPGSGPDPGSATNWAGLTTRELEVLELMGDGLDPRSIADRLVVSVHTARGHVKNVMMKVGAHSQLEAVVVATRTGLLPSRRSVT